MLPAGHQELVVADVQDDQVTLQLVRPVLAVKLHVAPLSHADAGARVTRELVRVTNTGGDMSIVSLIVMFVHYKFVF